MIEFLNCDCMEYMRTLPDGAFDLAIVDPPYGIGENAFRSKSRTKLAKTTDWGAFDSHWDSSCPTEEYFSELFRVSKNQIIWGGNHMMHMIKKSSPCWIVWDKNNSGCFADAELAFTSFPTAVRIFKWTWNGMIQHDMKNKQIRIHPTEKPVQLYQWVIQNYAKEGNKILDTHGGSMSHALAADKEGFDLTIIEKDKNYFDAAVKRFNQYKSQTTLFSFPTK